MYEKGEFLFEKSNLQASLGYIHVVLYISIL